MYSPHIWVDLSHAQYLINIGESQAVPEDRVLEPELPLEHCIETPAILLCLEAEALKSNIFSCSGGYSIQLNMTVLHLGQNSHPTSHLAIPASAIRCRALQLEKVQLLTRSVSPLQGEGEHDTE